MSRIQVLLLGPPEVRFNGENVQIQRRTTRALLFYLASQGGKVGRDQLLPLFWEDEAEQSARRRLSDTLSRLKTALPDPNLLHVDTSLVSLDFQRIEVDQLRFEQLVDQAGRLPWQIPLDQPLPEACYQPLTAAINLWRSPHFLAGANFPSTSMLDAWLSRTSQRLEQEYSRVVRRLADHASTEGDQDYALELTRLALLIDDIDEDLHYRHLDLLMHMGRYSEARQKFEAYQELLRRDLGIEPSPRLVALYRQIRSSSSSKTQVDTKSAWHIRQSVQVPFIGRQETLEYLQRSLYIGGGVFIFGEAGQGKTRLLQEFTAKIKPQRRLLVTTCRQAESNLPFQPLIELLRQYILPDEWLRLPAVWASQLSLLLPELTTLRKDLDRPVVETSAQMAPGQVRSMILEAVRQLFLLVFKKQPIILCLDDAHWADEATIATLAYLLERSPFESEALLVASARWEESSPYLEALMASLGQSSGVRVISLSRFTESEIKEMSRHVLGYIPPDPFASHLCNETGGNPFIILEALRTFLEGNIQPDFSRMSTLSVVKSIQDLVSVRMNLLTPAARDIIEAAAVLGTDFNPDMISEVTGHSPLEVGNALEELEKRSLIELAERSAGSMRYRFIHDVFREMLLQNIHPVRARWLHAQVAQILEMKPQTQEQAALLASHYEQAGETSLAFDYWIDAGKHARQLFSLTDAVWAFSRAEELISSAPFLSDEQILALYSEWSEMEADSENMESLQTVNTSLLKLGEIRNSPLLLGSALDGLSLACLSSTQYDQGLALTGQAIAYLTRSANPGKLMDAYLHRGTFLYHAKQYQQAIRAYEEALSLGEMVRGDQVLKASARAYYQRSLANLMNGRLHSAEADANQSLELFTSVNLVRGQISAYYALALARYYLGRYHQARMDSQLGITLAQRLQVDASLGQLYATLSRIELARGYVDLALELAERAIEIGEKKQLPEIASTGYSLIGDLYLWLHRPEQAAEYYQMAVHVSQDSHMVEVYNIRRGIALTQQAPGEPEIMPLLEPTEPIESGLVEDNAMLLKSLQLTKSGDLAGAYAVAEQLVDRSLEDGNALIHIMSARIWAEIKAEQGDSISALASLRSAIRYAADLPHPWGELELIKLMDHLQSQAGSPDPRIRQRIDDLLDHLDNHLSREPYKQAFLAFRQSFSLDQD